VFPPTRCRNDSLGNLINVNKDHYDVPYVNPTRLLTDRQEEILVQSPVKKSANRGVDLLHFQSRKIANASKWIVGVCYKPILLIAIKKNLQLIIRTGPRGNRVTGQKNFSEITPIKIEARRGIF